MKNLKIYYVFILVPLILLVLLVKGGYISSTIFGLSILAYGIVYHPLVSSQRLLELNIISKENFYKSLIPFWNTKYFKQLFWG